ncbi:MAG: hypothetical protein H7Y37_08435 [Anaerolineae bacterium]|nr:hypothetical protein [Gloeobacterales cyanobacterium ES-bin-313]
MDRRAFLAQLGGLLLVSRRVSAQNAPWQELEPVALGDGLKLRIRQAQNPGPVFFIPHNDENVAVRSVEQFWRTVQPMGTLIELQQFEPSGRNLELRYVYQTLQGTRIYADPNRIYSANLRITEKKLELGSSETKRCGVAFTTNPGDLGKQAARRFQTIGEKITAILRQYLSITDPLIVAMHNNTNDALQASPAYFSERQFELSDRPSAKSRLQNRDLDNFFLATQREDYARLRKLEWNSILQLPTAIDDGSLSIWAAKQQIRYINIEAEHVLCAQPLPRQVGLQVQMIAAAVQNISDASR